MQSIIQPRRLFALTAVIVAAASATACDPVGGGPSGTKIPDIHQELQLKYMVGPIEFTLSSNGSVSVELGREFNTPIGHFKLSSSGSVEDPRKISDGRFLLLRWHGAAHLYEIRTPDTLHIRVKQPVEIDEDIPGDRDTITLNITRGSQTVIELTKTTKPPEDQARSCSVGSGSVVCIWPPGVAGHYLW